MLIYNAVAFRQALPSQLKPQDLIDDLGTNLIGALAAAQTVLPVMQAGGGSILFRGGGWALHPDPAVASTAIGKASLRHLALMLAQELRQTIGKVFLEMHLSQVPESEVRFTGQ